MVAGDPNFGAEDLGVELDSYGDPFFAGVVAARLTDSGVQAWMVENRIAGRPVGDRGSVYVHRKDVDEARALLAQFADEDGEGSPLAQPEPKEPNAVGRFLNKVLGGDKPTEPG